MVRKEEFKRQDGTDGFNLYPEAGDKPVAQASSVYEREVLGVNKTTNKPFKSMKYGIQVKFNDGTEGFLNLTAGQKKGTDKVSDLLGKTLVFYEYENEYGKQIGCKVEE